MDKTLALPRGIVPSTEVDLNDDDDGDKPLHGSVSKRALTIAAFASEHAFAEVQGPLDAYVLSNKMKVRYLLRALPTYQLEGHC